MKPFSFKIHIVGGNSTIRVRMGMVCVFSSCINPSTFRYNYGSFRKPVNCWLSRDWIKARLTEHCVVVFLQGIVLCFWKKVAY